MKIIVILFLINGTWSAVEGWGEREARTEEECQVWVEKVSEFLEDATELEYKVYCKE